MPWDSAWVNPASLMVLCGSVVGQGLGLLVSKHHAWRRLRLQVAYLAVSAVAFMMVWWILVFPASCHAVYRQAWSDVLVFLKVTDFVPLTLLTKYNVQVCLSHQLPAVLWSVAVPLQLHPAWRGSYPQMHRIVGRGFLLLSAIMMLGVWLIDQQGLHFHINDFPTLRHHEASSFVFPAHVPRLEIMVVYFLFTGACAGVQASRKRFASHRTWVLRHVAGGFWVAVQRLLIGVAHGVLRPLADTRQPRLQKAIFADAAYLGILLSIILAEVAAVDMTAHGEQVHKVQQDEKQRME
jgi:hypothetical protein